MPKIYTEAGWLIDQYRKWSTFDCITRWLLSHMKYTICHEADDFASFILQQTVNLHSSFVATLSYSEHTSSVLVIWDYCTWGTLDSSKFECSVWKLSRHCGRVSLLCWLGILMYRDVRELTCFIDHAWLCSCCSYEGQKATFHSVGDDVVDSVKDSSCNHQWGEAVPLTQCHSYGLLWNQWFVLYCVSWLGFHLNSLQAGWSRQHPHSAMQVAALCTCVRITVQYWHAYSHSDNWYTCLRVHAIRKQVFFFSATGTGTTGPHHSRLSSKRWPGVQSYLK